MKAMYIAPVQLATSQQPDLTIGLIYNAVPYSLKPSKGLLYAIACNNTIERVYLTSNEFETAFKVIP